MSQFGSFAVSVNPPPAALVLPRLFYWQRRLRGRATLRNEFTTNYDFMCIHRTFVGTRHYQYAMYAHTLSSYPHTLFLSSTCLGSLLITTPHAIVIRCKEEIMRAKRIPSKWQHCRESRFVAITFRLLHGQWLKEI